MRGEMDCARVTAVVSQGDAETSIMAEPRVLTYEAGVEPKRRSTSEGNLQQKKGTIITSDQELQDLIPLNRMDELFMPKRWTA